MSSTATERIEGAAMHEMNAALDRAEDCDDDFRAIMRAVRQVCPQTFQKIVSAIEDGDEDTYWDLLGIAWETGDDE